ncbi:MAG: hypothetical protein AB7T49_09575 [Oligoflexales bacterium]
MLRRRNLLFGIVLTLLAVSVPAAAEEVVTHYIVTTQKERQDTRWTLTEWLRIKERMKLMDVWLAMFSDPKKDEFRPELSLTYGRSRAEVSSTGSGSSDMELQNLKAQLWLTNLISSTVGIRTLNIDLGVEGADTKPLDTAQASRLGAKVNYVSGNFRIFGKSVQDTSLIVKGGRYTLDEGDHNRTGAFAGGELCLYLTKWLGIEGTYGAYYSETFFESYDDFNGSYFDYYGFVEVSLLRLFVGKFEQDLQYQGTSQATSGLIGGIKLHL